MAQVRTDENVRADVREELAWDALVDESQIDVEVAGGVVTLVGTVDSLARKLAAEEAARSVYGVHDLVNAIDVRPASETRPTDGSLATMCRQVLAWDALVPDRNLDVSVSDGWVTLTGAVSVDAQRVEAERAVSHLAGVRGLYNRITVHGPDLSPDVVRGSIVDALRRGAVHRAAHIDITVDDGKVTLCGSTQSNRDKVAILGAVRHAPGIATVCDELRVEPSA